MRTACLAGTAYFKGNDRSPDGKVSDVGKAAHGMLGQVLPDVFTSFGEGAAKSGEVKRGFEALLVAADLQGLPSIFSSLGLVRDEAGKTVFDTLAPSLHALLADIEHSASYGQKETGRSLAEKFGRPPYGWDLDVVRLFVTVLIRAGAIQMTHKGTVVETTTTVAAKDALANNNNFRVASFQPKKGIEFSDVAKAGENFKDTFGVAVKELSGAAVASELRSAISDCQEGVQRAKDLLIGHRLPGGAILDDVIAQMRAIGRGSEEIAISEFNSSHQTIKEGIRRANELNATLTAQAVIDLEKARLVLLTQWPILDKEPDLEPEIRDRAQQLADLLDREAFFRELAEIDRAQKAIEAEHERRLGIALAEKQTVYRTALEELANTPGWPDLAEDAKDEIAGGLRTHVGDSSSTHPSIPQLRADREACMARLQQAVDAVHRLNDGDRIAPVDPKPFFLGGVDDMEQLGAALTGLREECERLIADGRKIVIR
jgi:hypothetical protein